MAVEGIIYQRGAWRDPVMRTEKERLPPWIPHDVAGTGWGRARGATQSPAWRIVIDLEKIQLEEHRRMERNEEIEFFFLIEEERRAEAFRVKKRVQAEARRAEGALQEAEARRAESADGTHPCESINTTFRVRNLTAATVTSNGSFVGV